MTTPIKVALLAGGGIALYMLFRRPMVTAANGQVVAGPSKIDELANRAGSFAGAAGTKIASAIPILKPIAGAVGYSAGADTRTNVRETANVIGGTKDIFTGNVTGGATRIAKASVAIAVSPIKSLGHVLGF